MILMVGIMKGIRPGKTSHKKPLLNYQGGTQLTQFSLEKLPAKRFVCLSLSVCVIILFYSACDQCQCVAVMVCIT